MARSKKDTSALVSALGLLMGIITALVSVVRKKGGTDEDIYRLATPEGESLLEKIAELIVQAGKPVQELAENCYKVVVDYGQNLAQMIAAGKYDYANSDIAADNFPITGNGQQNVIVELIHFGRVMESEAVLKEFEARGLCAATLPELLAFGATYPEKQCEFLIVALASMWQDRNGSRVVACLDYWFAKRRLHLHRIGYWWSDGCRFAAVRK